MKLLFKQRMFSWFDSYDIFDESGNPVYTVKGALSWGHLLRIYDRNGRDIGCVKEKVFTWLPKFEMYCFGNYMGCIKKEFTFFRPKFTVDCNGWYMEGNAFEWDYSVKAADGSLVACISKELWKWTDTYIIDIVHSEDALAVLMLVLAIDAEKCSRNNA